MGLFRYILQGFGWQLGAEAAKAGLREGKDALDRHEAAQGRPPSRRQLARAARQRAKQEARARKEQAAAAARRQAQIDDELRELKKKAGR